MITYWGARDFRGRIVSIEGGYVMLRVAVGLRISRWAYTWGRDP